jgi:hypothetical protein
MSSEVFLFTCGSGSSDSFQRVTLFSPLETAKMLPVIDQLTRQTVSPLESLALWRF